MAKHAHLYEHFNGRDNWTLCQKRLNSLFDASKVRVFPEIIYANFLHWLSIARYALLFGS
jgi:hypothetical protein